MEWLSLGLSLAALLAVGYLFYAKPWKAERESVLRKARRYTEDGDGHVMREIERALPKAEPKPTRVASPEKPKLPRNVSFTAWRALAEQEEVETSH